MAAFDSDYAAAGHGETEMMFDFPADKGVTACFSSPMPFIAAGTAAESDLSDYGTAGPP